jgi:hypothetical protein
MNCNRSVGFLKVSDAAEGILVFVAEHMESLKYAAKDLAYSIARVHMGKWEIRRKSQGGRER